MELNQFGDFHPFFVLKDQRLDPPMVSGGFSPVCIAGVWCLGPQNDAFRPLRGFRILRVSQFLFTPSICVISKSLEARYRRPRWATYTKRSPTKWKNFSAAGQVFIKANQYLEKNTRVENYPLKALLKMIYLFPFGGIWTSSLQGHY